eukprot:15437231-Alexandrium_andersonii.AAC.1
MVPSGASGTESEAISVPSGPADLQPQKRLPNRRVCFCCGPFGSVRFGVASVRSVLHRARECGRPCIAFGRRQWFNNN